MDEERTIQGGRFIGPLKREWHPEKLERPTINKDKLKLLKDRKGRLTGDICSRLEIGKGKDFRGTNVVGLIVGNGREGKWVTQIVLSMELAETLLRELTLCLKRGNK